MDMPIPLSPAIAGEPARLVTYFHSCQSLKIYRVRKGLTGSIIEI